jgi:probable phosphoglycerate mutase
MMLYLVRHGESQDLAAGRHQRPDSPLTEAGIKQAETLASRLFSLPVDAIMSSPLARGRQTAEIISQAINKPLEITPLLAEYQRPSQIEGQLKDNPEVIKIRQLIRRNIADPDYRYSDEETFTEFKTRVSTLIDEILQTRYENIILVTHGLTARMFLALILQGNSLTSEQYLAVSDLLSFSKTGLTIFKHTQDKGWKLITWNDHAHLAD